MTDMKNAGDPFRIWRFFVVDDARTGKPTRSRDPDPAGA
jgi:hypothetical protein